FDNDHLPDDLQGPQWQRWRPDGDAWEALDGGRGFRHGTRVGGGESYLVYRHALRGNGGEVSLITDFMGYNSGEPWEWSENEKRWTPPDSRNSASGNGGNWVGDLILECEVQVDKPEGEFVLELTRGDTHYRARWDLSDGRCTLEREGATKK